MTPSGFNKVILVGKLGKVPHLRYLDSGQAMADIWVVCTEASPREQGGTGELRSEWIPVRLWGEIAESTHKDCHKGDTVLVEGQLRSHSWQSPQGERHSRIELLAQRVARLASPATAPSPAAELLASFDPLEALSSPDEPDEVPF